MICAACGSENEQGRKFCGECGGPLAISCPACGAPNPASVKFCGECGTALAAPSTRAVRAALELVGGLELPARAGVLTGEAAVTLGADGQGMVAGDLVNTASRIQAAAPSGAVLVGERTRRAAEAAVAYEETGLHRLKGKDEPVLAEAREIFERLGARPWLERAESAFRPVAEAEVAW